MVTKTKYDTTLTLPSDREILMTRKFDAPREIVWDTITDAELIPQWWGFAADATEVKKMDVRPGGKWQYITHTSGGEVVDFHGTYREVIAPEKLVYSFLFGDMPEGDGFVRDATIATGMEEGARETYERLSALIATRVG